jgi:hypothetical protein
MLKLATISKLFFAVAFAGLLGACGGLQQDYDACLDNPSACEMTEGDAISTSDAISADAAAVDAAAGNSCSATSLDGSSSCQVTCPSHERAICSSNRTTASCGCFPATPPPVVTPAPIGN